MVHARSAGTIAGGVQPTETSKSGQLHTWNAEVSQSPKLAAGETQAK